MWRLIPRNGASCRLRLSRAGCCSTVSGSSPVAVTTTSSTRRPSRSSGRRRRRASSRRWTRPASAQQAFKSWSRTTPEHRAEILDRVADLLVKHGEEIIPLLQAETGATMRVASTMQVPVAVDRFRRYARDAMLSDTIPLPPHADERDRAGSRRADRRRGGAPAGRCRRLHHARTTSRWSTWPARSLRRWRWATPSSSSRRRRTRCTSCGSASCCSEAGIPPGVVNIVSGSGRGRRRGADRSPDVDMVSFTGSTPVGRIIAARLRRRHEAPAARARRQGRGDRLRGRRRRPRRRRYRPAPGPSTPARSAPRPPGCWCTAASATS